MYELFISQSLNLSHLLYYPTIYSISISNSFTLQTTHVSSLILLTSLHLCLRSHPHLAKVDLNRLLALFFCLFIVFSSLLNFLFYFLI